MHIASLSMIHLMDQHLVFLDLKMPRLGQGLDGQRLPSGTLFQIDLR
jgi:hypothetical protein